MNYPRVPVLRFLAAMLIIPLVAFSSQLRVWPEIKDASPLVKLAKEKVSMRERYRATDRKLDVATLPRKEWSKAIVELKPEEVFIEQGCLLIVLMFYPEGMQAVAVIADDTAFKNFKSALLVEDTSDKRIKRIFTKPK